MLSCFSFVSQGPRGPDGLIGEPGPEGVKVKRHTPFGKPAFDWAELLITTSGSVAWNLPVLRRMNQCWNGFLASHVVIYFISLPASSTVCCILSLLQGERGEIGKKGEPGFIVSVIYIVFRFVCVCFFMLRWKKWITAHSNNRCPVWARCLRRLEAHFWSLMAVNA